MMDLKPVPLSLCLLLPQPHDAPAGPSTYLPTVGTSSSRVKPNPLDSCRVRALCQDLTHLGELGLQLKR